METNFPSEAGLIAAEVNFSDKVVDIPDKV
jgi:hypothetical protein